VRLNSPRYHAENFNLSTGPKLPMQMESTGRIYGACPVLGLSRMSYKQWAPMEPFVVKPSLLGLFPIHFSLPSLDDTFYQRYFWNFSMILSFLFHKRIRHEKLFPSLFP